MDQLAAHQDSVPAPAPFRAGVEDVVILPLVLIAFGIVKLLKATLRLLIRLLDFLFPILLQIMRFPLFTLRILGDGIVVLTKAVVAILPVGGARRTAWRDAVSTTWAWLRRKISYRAFEEWVHHAFEDGMAWVFRNCRTLTPRAALLVMLGAILWLPISFGAATLLHAVLIAKATSLPAWMQLLHPFATVIAKSKLLVLPVYPAAWPQAKQHLLVQAMFRFCRAVGRLHLSQKAAYRYRQTAGVWNDAIDAARHGSAALGLTALWKATVDNFNAAAFMIGRGTRSALMSLVGVLAAIPLFGGIVRRYQQHYEDVSRHPRPPVSERVTDFYGRWSVKFTAKYYEDREREQAAKRQAGA